MDGHQGAAQDDVFRAVERELALLFRRGRARAAELAREVHPELESGAYALLAYVEAEGKVRLTDIGAHFGVGKPTVSRQVKALEELGLVSREADPLDGRASLLSLTPKGASRYDRAREARRERYRRLLSTWERRDVAEFARLLHRFNEQAGD